MAPQAAEWGMMDALAKRPSVKVCHRLRSVMCHGIYYCVCKITLFSFDRQSLLGTTTGWTGAARTRRCGYVLLGTPVMEVTATGPEEQGSFK